MWYVNNHLFNQQILEVGSNPEKVIAVVEKQAILEALIQSLVNNFDLTDDNKLSNVCKLYF